jgi:hypothetical protein
MMIRDDQVKWLTGLSGRFISAMHPPLLVVSNNQKNPGFFHQVEIRRLHQRSTFK